MNRLPPELSRLLAWAQQAPKIAPPPVPPGFAARVARNWNRANVPDLVLIWQRAIWASAWAAAAVIGLGLVLLNSQKLGTNSPYDFSPAYQVVSTELVP